MIDSHPTEINVYSTVLGSRPYLGSSDVQTESFEISKTDIMTFG